MNRERKGKKNSSHVAEWLRACATRQGFESRASLFFFFHCAFLPLIFVKIFFACDQKYPLQISTGMGVIDYADSECAVFSDRQRFFQNCSGVIWSIKN